VDEALDTSCVSVPIILRLKRKPLGFSECATNAFLHALASAFIDAIPLSMLTKLRNFLWLGNSWWRCEIDLSN